MGKPALNKPSKDSFPQRNELVLKNGSSVAIIGGGPAGSFAGHYFKDISNRADLDINVDIFEPKDYTVLGPLGCNHCGGVVSESLVQHLAAEGINIPKKIIQRGLNGYVLHMDTGSVRINTPTLEKRIVTMFRGAGPRSDKEVISASFDGYLQNLTKKSGVNVVHDLVKKIEIDDDGYPVLSTRKGIENRYDLVVGAGGLKPSFFKLFKNLDLGFLEPSLTKTSICEFHIGREMVHKYFGDAMHVFLLDIPRLKFAALIPKDDFVTLALLGEKIDKNLLKTFLESPVVKNCFSPEWDLSNLYSCQCFPSINVQSAIKPFGDRIVLIGDSATTKLYKNGIGAAYVTAKAAASTAILQGISVHDFEKHYWPVCNSIKRDNFIGKKIFSMITIVQKQNFIKRAMLNVVHNENKNTNSSKSLSMVLWDTFTGSAPYRDILWRMFRPSLFLPFFGQMILSLIPGKKENKIFKKQDATKTGLGNTYQDGELIIKQGDPGNCMYFIRKGKVDVIFEENSKDTWLTTLKKGDFFGEMALFEKELRSTSVRANGKVQIITIDKKTLLKRIKEDPTLAFRLLEKMSFRLRELNQKVSHQYQQT